MEQQPLVSVVINCYNGEEYLRETIDSVITQTYSNWEIIFWDNQSTDSTAEIVKSYKDDRIRYFYAPIHTPLGEARNLALEKIKGEFVGFLDADDKWAEVFLEEGVNCFVNNPRIKAYYANFYAVYPAYRSLSIRNKKSGIRTIRDIVQSYDIGMSVCLVSSSIVQQYNIRIDNRYQLIEDFDFFAKVALYTDYYYDDRSMMYYRMHESASRKQRLLWNAEFKLIYNYFLGLVNDGILQMNDLEQLKRKIFVTSLDGCVEKHDRFGCFITIIKNIGYIRYSWKYMIYSIMGSGVFNILINNNLKACIKEKITKRI